MCGIIAYAGNKEAFPVVINGLKRLEYRGYDSAGIALVNKNITLEKCKGKVECLEEKAKSKNKGQTIGLGHTRWATHGEPNEKNAHPHLSEKGHFVLVHNGIIENYAEIKDHLSKRGVRFSSETDTEVLVNLIEHLYLEGDLKAEKAVEIALSRVDGAYGIVCICKEEPGKIIAARKGSPLVIGIGDGEHFLASDATPIVEYTKSVVYLNDDDLVVIENGSFKLKTLRNLSKEPQIEKLDLDIGEIDKGGFPHFMLKEIYEQPKAISDTFRGRLLKDYSNLNLGGLHELMPNLIEAKKMTIIACGTSWHAALIGEYLFEEFARIPVEVEYASEFRYRNPILEEKDFVLAISQSGETADTLAAIRMAKEKGARVAGICNVVGSGIPRETDGGVYTHAGPEIGVASTKAFTAQVTVLAMMAFLLGHKRNYLSDEEYSKNLRELAEIPGKIEEMLKYNQEIKNIAEKIKNCGNAIYLGRGYMFPVALEGALKLKEISYIHAEGYPAAEMKHGPIALIDENMPVVVIAPKDNSHEKIVSNIQEIKSRKGIIIALVTKGDQQIRKMADYLIEVPESIPALAALTTVVPLQLLSYHIAVLRGCNVDQPRNLAKSVTVE